MRIKELRIDPDAQDCQVIIHGSERMVLIDNNTKQAKVVAERTGGHTWGVKPADHESPIEPVSTEDRDSAVTAIANMRLALGPKQGYSIFEHVYKYNGEPTRLRDLP